MSILLLLLLASFGSIAFVCLGVVAVRRLLRQGVGKGHNEVLAAVFQAGGTIYAVFLAFLVVAVWESHDAAHVNVAEEASLLSSLYRGSTAMEPDSGGKLRLLIREYTHLVIDKEWALQAQSDGASPEARTTALKMFRLFGAESPATRVNDGAIDQLQLATIAQMQADRNKRTLQAGESISPVIWSAAIADGFLVVIMSLFLYTDRAWPQMVMCSVLSVMIAMLLCVVFIFDRPFGGLMPLAPAPFEHSLQVYDSVDRTP